MKFQREETLNEINQISLNRKGVPERKAIEIEKFLSLRPCGVGIFLCLNMSENVKKV